MFEDADKFMKIAVGLGILAAGIGVGYHFAIYIPQHERERIAADEQREREKMLANERRERDRIAAARKTERDKQALANSEFETCKDNAWLHYKSNWDVECKINGTDKKSRGCTLPVWSANIQDEKLKDAKQICLEVYKAKMQ